MGALSAERERESPVQLQFERVQRIDLGAVSELYRSQVSTPRHEEDIDHLAVRYGGSVRARGDGQCGVEGSQYSEGSLSAYERASQEVGARAYVSGEFPVV